MMSSVLQKPTLVLNRSWQPISIVSVARSLTKVFQGIARVVDPESYQQYDWADWSELTPHKDEPCIRSQRISLRIPEVIVLVDFDGQPSRRVTFSRRNVFKRDRFTCQYCNRQPGHDELTIDHVIPRSKGGESSWANCVLACIQCNSKKADYSLEEIGMRLKKTPEPPAWRPIYAAQNLRIASWSKFVSESYWNAELE